MRSCIEIDKIVMFKHYPQLIHKGDKYMLVNFVNNKYSSNFYYLLALRKEEEVDLSKDENIDDIEIDRKAVFPRDRAMDIIEAQEKLNYDKELIREIVKVFREELKALK